jgi:hypothetical protein
MTPTTISCRKLRQIEKKHLGRIRTADGKLRSPHVVSVWPDAGVAGVLHARWIVSIDDCEDVPLSIPCEVSSRSMALLRAARLTVGHERGFMSVLPVREWKDEQWIPVSAKHLKEKLAPREIVGSEAWHNWRRYVANLRKVQKSRKATQRVREERARVPYKD